MTKKSTLIYAKPLLRAVLLWLLPVGLAFAQRSVTSLEYGQVFGYPSTSDYSQTGILILLPHSAEFANLPADAIQAPHGHFQHFAPARTDDDFPYGQLRELEAQQIAAGGPPIFCTATYGGVSRPVYFQWTLELDANGHPTADPGQWQQPVNLRDETFIQFFANTYIPRIFQPYYPNYWLAVDNCSFFIDLYGVLDDNNVWHSVSQFDQPFAQSDPDFLDSIVYFFQRLNQIAPNIHIMGNEGSMSDESRFAEVWSGFSGTFREDITEGFQPDSYDRDYLYTSYKRYQWEGAASKAAVLRALIPNDSTFQDKLRTAYVAYLIFRGPNFFFAPRYADATDGIPISAYGWMQAALGQPTGPATDQAYGDSDTPGYRLYSRPTAHGIVYLNWSGYTLTISLPQDKTYVDRNTNVVKALTIPDLSGDYVLFH